MSGYIEPPCEPPCATGCHWHGGGICSVCGARLRCPLCGCFTTEDGINDHIEKQHPEPGESKP